MVIGTVPFKFHSWTIIISIFKNIDENCSFSGLHENEKLPKYILLVGKQGQTVYKTAIERQTDKEK